MLADGCRKRILQAHSIGPRMLALIEQSGIGSYEELADLNANDLAFRIEMETGIRLSGNGIKALSNLVE